MRRGASLPLQLEVGRARSNSTSSAGSADSALGNAPEEARAVCLQKVATKAFSDGNYERAYKYIEQSLALHYCPEAEKLRTIIISSLRNAQNNSMILSNSGNNVDAHLQGNQFDTNVRSSCPAPFSHQRNETPSQDELADVSGPGGPIFSTSPSLLHSDMLRSEKGFVVGCDEKMSKGYRITHHPLRERRKKSREHRSFDAALLRSSSSSSASSTCSYSSSSAVDAQTFCAFSKPPRLERKGKTYFKNNSGYQQRVLCTSPTIFQRTVNFDSMEETPERKRRRSNNHTLARFDHLTLDDTNDPSVRKNTSVRASRDSVRTALSELDVDSERTQMYSPTFPQGTIEEVEQACDDQEQCHAACNLPIAAESPKFLPGRNIVPDTPPNLREKLGEGSYLLSEEKQVATSCDVTMSGMEGPQPSESPILRPMSSLASSRRPAPLYRQASLQAPGIYTSPKPMKLFSDDIDDACLLTKERSRQQMKYGHFEQDENDANAANRLPCQKRSHMEISPNPCLATPTKEEVFSACARVDVREHVSICKQNHIKLVALDFDKTFIRIHTKGCWNSSPAELACHIRPVFHSFVPALLRAGIIVAIVTFSPQTDLIKHLLVGAFPDDVRIGENVFVCGDLESRLCCRRNAFLHHQNIDEQQQGSSTPRSTTSRESDEMFSPSTSGKRQHIASVCNEYFIASGGKQVASSEVLLIDDDPDNIRLAHLHQIKAIQFQVAERDLDSEYELLVDLMSERWLPPTTTTHGSR